MDVVSVEARAPARRSHRLLRSLALALATTLGLGAAIGRAGATPARLPVRGFRDAALVAPPGSRQAPVVVGLHGNFDRPEWFCAAMDELAQGQAWLLCPRGVPRTDVPPSYDRWTFGPRARVLAELEAGLAAVEARHEGRLAPGPVLLAGFSLGAILASRFATADPARFPLLYLVEGGQNVWTPAAVRAFAAGGGRAVLFGCGRRGCDRSARRICSAFQAAGVSCSVATAEGLGHGYTEPLIGAARAEFRKLLERAGRPRGADRDKSTGPPAPAARSR